MRIYRNYAPDDFIGSAPERRERNVQQRVI